MIKHNDGDYIKEKLKQNWYYEITLSTCKGKEKIKGVLLKKNKETLLLETRTKEKYRTLALPYAYMSKIENQREIIYDRKIFEYRNRN